MDRRDKIIEIIKKDEGTYAEIADKILELDEGLSEGEILDAIESLDTHNCWGSEYKTNLARAISGRIAKPQEPVCECEDKYQDPRYANKDKDCPIHGKKEPVCSCTIDNGILRNKDCSRHGKEKPKKLEYVKDPFDNEELAHKVDDIIDVINKLNERINGGRL